MIHVLMCFMVVNILIITFLDFLPLAMNGLIGVFIYKRECLAIAVPAMELNNHMILII